MFEVEDPDMVLEGALEVSDPDMVLEPVAGKPRPRPPRRPKPPVTKPKQPTLKPLSQSQMIEQGSIYQSQPGAVKATVVEDQEKFDRARGYDPRLITDSERFEQAKLLSEQRKIEVGKRAFLRWPQLGDPDYDPKGQSLRLGLDEEGVRLEDKTTDWPRAKQLQDEESQWGLRKYVEPFAEMALPGQNGLAGQVLGLGAQLGGPLGAFAKAAQSPEGKALALGSAGTMQSSAVGLDLALKGLFGDETPETAGAFPIDRMQQLSPKEQESWGVQFMQGLGSSFPFIAVGLLSGGSSGAMALGAASNAGQVYQEARRSGATEDNSKAAATVAALIGMLEGVWGVGGQAGHVMESLAAARRGLTSWVKEAGGEGIQEVVSQLLNNANAKWINGYDPTRALWEGLIQNFTVGAAVGGAFHLPNLPGAVANTANWAQQKVEFSVGQSPHDTKGGTTLGTVFGGLNQLGLRSTPGEKVLKLPEKMTVEQANGLPLYTKEAISDVVLTPQSREDMYLRAREADKLLLFSEEQRQRATEGLAEQKKRLLEMNPSDPEFEEVSQSATDLMQALADSEGIDKVTTLAELKEFLMDRNMWHEPTVNELMGIVSPETTASESSPVLEARFYEHADPDKSGNLYVSPQLGKIFDVGPMSKSASGAVNAQIWYVQEKYREAIANGVSPEVLAPVRAAILEVADKGLASINILPARAGMRLSEVRTLTQHESFHSGQEMLRTNYNHGDVLTLHSPDITSHPLVERLKTTAPGRWIRSNFEEKQQNDGLAMELAAYAAAGQVSFFREGGQQLATQEDLDAYLVDYLDDLADGGGSAALTQLERHARLSPKVRKLITPIKEAYAERERVRTERRNQFRAQSDAAARDAINATPGGSRPSLSAPDGEGTEPGTAEGGDAGLVGPPSGGVFDVRWDDDPLLKKILNEPYVKGIFRRGVAAAEELGIARDPGMTITQQIRSMLEDGDIESDLLVRTFAKYGLDPYDLAHALGEAVSTSGRILAEARIASERMPSKLLPTRGHATEKELMRARIAMPAAKVVRQQLQVLQASDLGRSLWLRSADLIRKMILSQFSIAAVNVLSSLGRLSMDSMVTVPQSIALAILNPEKYGGSAENRLAAVQKALNNQLKPMAAVLAGMNPIQLIDIVQKKPARYQSYFMSVAQILEQDHPEIHSKIFDPQKDRVAGDQRLNAVRRLREMAEVAYPTDNVTDPTKLRDLENKRVRLVAEVKELEKREGFNRSLAGRIFRGAETFYGAWLTPSNWQEFAFRRPAFVGALRAEIEGEGLDFGQMIRDKNFAGVTPEMMQRAVDYALTLTYAYDPKADGPLVERGAHQLITFINRMGPLGVILGEAFPRAIYNGLKFAYETSPLGLLGPTSEVYKTIKQAQLEGRKTTAAEALTPEVLRRMSMSFVGFAMYGMAAALRHSLGGEEWWQIKAGTRADGKPRYVDIRRYQPFAFMVWAVDYTQRIASGRATDKSIKDGVEMLTSMRMAGSYQGGALDAIDALAQEGGTDGLSKFLRTQGGQMLQWPVIFATNLRDLYVTFDQEQNVRKDVKGNELLGPALDRLPWFRNRLPNATNLTEAGPQEISGVPLMTQILGITTRSGGNFITRELARLGINPGYYLHSDPDPEINRAQRTMMGTLVEEIATKLSQDAEYQGATDVQKGAILENYLMTLAEYAKEAGAAANPLEIKKREALREAGPRLKRKATGAEEQIKKDFETLKAEEKNDKD